MSQSIQNNDGFRKLLMRASGATGVELQEFTGRAYTYSLWSLRCMCTDTHSLYTQREGRIMRYYLLTDAQAAKKFPQSDFAKNYVKKLEKANKKKVANDDVAQAGTVTA